jgi:hypothetical protein
VSEGNPHQVTEIQRTGSLYDRFIRHFVSDTVAAIENSEWAQGTQAATLLAQAFFKLVESIQETPLQI